MAAVLCDVLRATNREKVQRVIFATFRVSQHCTNTISPFPSYVYVCVVDSNPYQLSCPGSSVGRALV